MKVRTRVLTAAAALVGSAAFVSAPAAAAGHGGGFGGAHSAGPSHSFGGGGWRGGRPGGYYHGGYYRGGYWGHRGYWPGPFWGGVGLGLGIGAIGYYASAPGYASYPYYGYYDEPGVVVSPGYSTYSTVEPAPVARSGQAVPQASRAPDPIFYPRNGQSTATAESDRRECNRWATTQPGAMADGSIFQRATLACMEGRGYTVK